MARNSQAQGWFEKMQSQGIQPDDVTYNTLMDKSPDYATALNLYEEMIRTRISPSEVTHTILVKKAPDITSALILTKRINNIHGYIGRGYFCALFSKDISLVSGDELLRIYNSLPFHFENSLEPAIKTYAAKGSLDDALRLCLFAPHLPAAIKFYRQKPKEVITWFHNLLEKEPKSSNGIYGLGICLFENGRFTEAESYLLRARYLAYADARKKHIDSMLREIENRKE